VASWGVLIGTLVTAMPCTAQSRTEITPFAGLYPQTALFTFSTSSPACLVPFGVSCSVTAALNQNDAVAVGGRLTTWESKRVALDLSVGHWGSDAGGGHANVTIGSLGILFNLSSSPDSGSAFAVGGLSVVALGGSAYGGPNAIAPSQGDWGPFLGLGGRIPFSRTIVCRVEVDDHFYWLTDLGGVASSTSRQHALVFSLGPSVRLGHRTRRPRAHPA
jgi:hypothetical protein